MPIGMHKRHDRTQHTVFMVPAMLHIERYGIKAQGSDHFHRDWIGYARPSGEQRFAFRKS
jgi:hypothetical protein